MTFLVGWAYEHGLEPEVVLKRYKRNPRNYYLLMAYGNYKAEREKTAMEEERKTAEKKAASRRPTR